MRKYTFLYIAALLFGMNAFAGTTAHSNIVQKRFFHLSEAELKIDSVLPVFGYAQELQGCFRDSAYSVRVVYPEYLDLSPEEEAAYLKLTEADGTAAKSALPEVFSDVRSNRGKGTLMASFCPIVFKDNAYKKLAGFMLEVTSAPQKTNAPRRAAALERYTEKSLLAEGRWAKIRVEESGIYQLTEAVIRKAGFSDLSKVKIYGYGGNLQNERFVVSELIETDDLKELPTCSINGKRLFYGKGPVHYKVDDPAAKRVRNPYSTHGYYFITQSDEEPLMLDSAAFVATFYPANEDYHVLHEVDNYSWYQGGRNLVEDLPIEAGTMKEWTFVLPRTSDNSEYDTGGNGNLQMVVSAGQTTTYEVLVNGVSYGTASVQERQYSHGNSATFTRSLPESVPDTLKIGIRVTGGGPLRLDYIDIGRSMPKALPILSRATFPAAEYSCNITNQNLHGDSEYDMVIIMPTSQKLRSQAMRLKEFHEVQDNMKVRVVPADELYNEFSSGTPDANAYRRYLKMLYDRANGDETKMPKYLVLFGDCAYDNRMLTSNWRTCNPDDYLLCFESENSFSETECYVDDGWFCLLDDGEGDDPFRTNLLDIAVGRIPATSATEARIAVDKTVNYVKNKNAGAWQNKIVFMGDDGNKNIHMDDANTIATTVGTLNPAFQISKIMWDAYEMVSSSTGATYPEARKNVIAQQNAGALIMNYSGHGRADQLSHESVLELKDFASFTNKNLPLWITAACDVMPFDQRLNTIGETALFNENGGAVAFFGTTRTVFTTKNRPINMEFLRALLTPVNGEYITIGEAQRVAKNKLTSKAMDVSTNKLQYSLLGDPALRLNIPVHKVVIDSINGVKVNGTSNTVQLKATSLATISGHVERNGSEDENFDGIVNLNVRDAVKTIVCRLNNNREEDGADKAFVYEDRPNTIYCGNDSVRGGRFQLTFIVPKDIQYDNGTGLINAFAWNGDYESAHGFCENFVANSTEEYSTDSIGPSLFCYLNTPSFQNGGDVNSTPFFYAEINDKDGINATGSGVGHDLQLVVDGKMTMTYNLNDNFVYDFGSYTSGHTSYSLPPLSEGKHTLRFRAWDILNNSSSTTLTFNVVKNLDPEIVSISCTNNPARDNTTFILSHDRSNSNIDVEIEVMDMTGKVLWRNVANGITTDSGHYTVDWDLSMSNGGKLQTGIYLYRVRMSSEGSNKVSKAKKLIVINN